jgi:hypothetical protein
MSLNEPGRVSGIPQLPGKFVRGSPWRAISGLRDPGRER